MNDISQNLSALQTRIAAACRNSGRNENDILLMAVSKTKPVSAVETAASLGLSHFGENYLDDALPKIEACRSLGLTWHFIGRIQSNKTRQIAEHFDWVHTVDRARIAKRLNDQCPDGKNLQVLIQVNIDADPAKGGVLRDDVPALIDSITALPRLTLRGLMTILAQDSNPVVSYTNMAELFNSLGQSLQHGSQWNVLSMGMTNDLEDAIAAGSTCVRVGTALFGPRS